MSIARVLRWIVLALLASLALPARGQPAEGARVYATHCSACHGPDGRGTEQALLAFPIPVPDFTDCNFATREPRADWYGVAHGGGPARGFNRRMPAFEGQLNREELFAAIAHVKSFCREKGWPRGELNFPRAIATEKAFPEDEAVLTTAVSTRGPASVTNKLIYEQRVGDRSQFEVIVPFGVRRDPAAGAWGEGIGDVAVGWKTALWHSFDTGSIFSLAAELVLPTGDELDGFGKGTFVVEPFLAFGQNIPYVGFLHLQAGGAMGLDPARAPLEAFGRVALGHRFVAGDYGRVWAPIVELLAAREFVDGATTEWAVLPQLHVTLSQRQHVILSLGVKVPLEEDPAPEVMAYLLWDWFDGGLFEGW